MAWAVYDAKARFSEFLDAAIKDGPQVVTRRGVETAVLVPIEEWKRLKERTRPNMKDPLMDPDAPHDIPFVKIPFKPRPFDFSDDGDA